jgi:hypothetical protein
MYVDSNYVWTYFKIVRTSEVVGRRKVKEMGENLDVCLH